MAGLQRLHSFALILTVLVALAGGGARAHDIPAEVRITAFFKPTGDKAELLVRVPMSAMREVEMPTRGPGYLVVSAADAALTSAVRMWLIANIELRENGTALPAPRIVHARVSLPSDKSFAEYESARAHVSAAKLADDLDLYWNQQLLDVLLEYPIRSDRSDFAIAMRMERVALKTQSSLRFLPPGGAIRAYELHADAGLVHLDPRWHQSAGRFLVSGFWHILEGIDHLLFLACLVIPFRQIRPLVAIVTAFTLAHSVTLAASALGAAPEGLWFAPLIETLIALTVLYMALENIVGASIERRWMMAFAFGLIHGFGFSFALREELQFAGDHLLTALLAFNVGVEIGQLAALAVLIPLLALALRLVDERIGCIILSTLVAHTAWHWMLDRGGEVAKFPRPRLDAELLAGAMRLAMITLIAVAAVWLARDAVRRWLRMDARAEPGSHPPRISE